jgi:hypothetical protein
MYKLQAAFAALAASAALGSAAQVGPDRDYTDMWWNPSESGWGISIRQKLPVGGDETTRDALFSFWYTYDPRAIDPRSGGTGNVPLWIVMPGGQWVTPTRYTGTMYVLSGTPYFMPWNFGERQMTAIGTYRFDFTDADHGIFTYAIAPPAGLPPTDPAYGLPAHSGSKAILRQSF